MFKPDSKILIIEDAYVSRSLLKSILETLNYTNIIEAEDGQEALNVLKEHPDTALIFSDINMPNMTGIEFLQHKAGNPEISKIPIVMTTAEGETNMVLQAITLGANNYIVKPIKPETIAQKMIEVAKQLQK